MCICLEVISDDIVWLRSSYRNCSARISVARRSQPAEWRLSTWHRRISMRTSGTRSFGLATGRGAGIIQAEMGKFESTQPREWKLILPEFPNSGTIHGSADSVRSRREPHGLSALRDTPSVCGAYPIVRRTKPSETRIGLLPFLSYPQRGMCLATQFFQLHDAHAAVTRRSSGNAQRLRLSRFASRPCAPV